MTRRSTRRDFLKQTTAAGVGFWIAGTSLSAASKSANEKLNLACIGCGGQGNTDVGGVSSENLVALCDVDDQRAAKTFDKHPKAKKFKDFRKMLDEMGKEIDGVTVSTPDHTHAVASVAAMKAGKHVYCQKPLAHDVYETRVMRDAARKMKVVTQMGNQGTSGSKLRRTAELIQAGEIGPVEEVHIWTNRPIWPQGKSRPKEADPVPPTLDWDLWLGTAAERPYSKDYMPFVWRGWWDFGTGAIGDMGCHTVNLPYLALKLTYPTVIEAESSPLTPENRDSYPTWAKVVFHFPARGDQPPVKVTWYEGHRDGKLVLPPAELLHGQKFSNSGSLIVGSKGTVYSQDDYGNNNAILRGKGEVEPVKGDPEKYPKSPGQYQEWIQAIKGGNPTMSNFNHASALTESILLGNVAIATGKKLEWNHESMKATNCPEADKYIRREYRSGWTL